jgi:ketosteroid isomerase-like protein
MILICRGIADAADPAADGAARAAFDAASREDPDGIVATGAPGYVDDFVAVGEIRGHDAVRAYFRELFAAFPDFTMTVARIVADDTTAAVQWHAAGMFIARSACCQASHPAPTRPCWPRSTRRPR